MCAAADSHVPDGQLGGVDDGSLFVNVSLFGLSFLQMHSYNISPGGGEGAWLERGACLWFGLISPRLARLSES